MLAKGTLVIAYNIDVVEWQQPHFTATRQALQEIERRQGDIPKKAAAYLMTPAFRKHRHLIGTPSPAPDKYAPDTYTVTRTGDQITFVSASSGSTYVGIDNFVRRAFGVRRYDRLEMEVTEANDISFTAKPKEAAVVMDAVEFREGDKGVCVPELGRGVCNLNVHAI